MSIYDYRGLKCPVPVLKAFKIVKENKKTNSFIFLADDKSAPKDFQDFCKNANLNLTEIKKIKKYYKIIIERINFEK